MFPENVNVFKILKHKYTMKSLPKTVNRRQYFDCPIFLLQCRAVEI